MTNSSITALWFILLCLSLLLWQYFADGKYIDFFNAKTLFQLHFILILPVNLFVGVTFNLPGFSTLSSYSTPIDEVFFLGFVFFMALLIAVSAYYFTGNKCLPLPKVFFKKWIYSRAKLLSIIYYVIGYISFFWLMKINGGYANFVENVEYFRAYGVAYQGFWVFMATSLPAMAGLSLIISEKVLGGKDSFLKLLIIIIATILPASQLGFRSLFLIPIFQILFLYNFRVKKINLMRFLPFLILVIISFTFYGIYRSSNHLMHDGLDVSVAYNYAMKDPELFLGSITRTKGADIFAFLLNSINNSNDYLLFLPALVEMATIIIPRGIWHGKPTPLGVQFSGIFWDKSGGISPTIVGEGYWHGGYIGIILIMLIAGIFLRLYQNRVDKSSHYDSVIYILAIIFPNIMLIPETFQGYGNGIVLKLVFSVPLVLIFSIRFRKTSNTISPWG